MHQIKSASLLGLVALAGFSASAWEIPLDGQKLDVHGFGSQGFLYSTDYNYLGHSTDGSFEFNEVGLNASMSPFKRTRITAQGFMFDLGNVGNYHPFLDYASIEYTFNDYIGIRGGRVRRPGGIYNHIQDVDLARTAVLLPQGIYDARWRDFSTSLDGGTVFGSVSLGKAGSLSYEGFAGMMHLADEGGIARLLQDSLKGAGGTVTGFDSFLNAGVQLWWNTPVTGLRAGAHVNRSFQFAYDYYITIPGLGQLPARAETDAISQQYSLEYVWNSWTFQAEYYLLSLDSSDTLRGASKGYEDAWYVGAAYRFNKWFETGTYYTEFYPDQTDRNSNSDKFQKDVALSLRFDPKDWWVIKLEAHYIRGTALLQNNSLNPVRDDNGWWLFAAKTTFSF